MQRAVRWLFEDRSTGRIVVFQWPNIPLWIWIISGVVGLVVSAGWISVVGTVALAVWAVLEIWKGVNPFRRGLGAIVLLGILARLVR
jgi:hypothetical protein